MMWIVVGLKRLFCLLLLVELELGGRLLWCRMVEAFGDIEVYHGMFVGFWVEVCILPFIVPFPLV